MKKHQLISNFNLPIELSYSFLAYPTTRPTVPPTTAINMKELAENNSKEISGEGNEIVDGT